MSRASGHSLSSGHSIRSSHGYQNLAKVRRQHHRDARDEDGVGDGGEVWPLPHKTRAKPPRRNRGMTVGAILRSTLSRAGDRNSKESSRLSAGAGGISRERSLTDANLQPGNTYDDPDATISSFDTLLSPSAKKSRSGSSLASRIRSLQSPVPEPRRKPTKPARRTMKEPLTPSKNQDSTFPDPCNLGPEHAQGVPDFDSQGRLSSVSSVYRSTLFEAAGRKLPGNIAMKSMKSPDSRGESPLYSEKEFGSRWSTGRDNNRIKASMGSHYPEYHESLRHSSRKRRSNTFYESRHTNHVYADPKAIFKALPSRQIGPSLNGGPRLKRGSVKASVNRFDGSIGLRSVASSCDDRSLRSPHCTTPYEDYYDRTEGKDGPPLPPKLDVYGSCGDLRVHDGTVATGILLRPSMYAMHTGQKIPASTDVGGIAPSKSTFSVYHAGAGLTGNLNTRRTQLDRLRQPAVGLSCSERISYKLFRMKRKLGDYAQNAWFTIGFWRSSLKTIEGRFGTGVVAYFNFLRGLLFLNFLLTLVVMCFVVGPQISISASDDRLFVNETYSTVWYNQLADAVTGRGALRRSVIYQAAYAKASVKSYNIPHAYFFTSLSVLVISFVWVAKRVAMAYEQRHVQKLNARYKFTNKVFSGWDYNISNAQSAYIKSISIRRDLQEEVTDVLNAKRDHTWQELFDLIRRRVFVNIVVLGLFALAGWCIYIATAVSIQATRTSDAQGAASESALYYIRTLASSLTIAGFSAVLPPIFEKLTEQEKWRKPSLEVKYTLIRTVFVRLASIGVLVVSLYLRLKDCHVKNIKQSPECECWEVSVGQEFYQLALVNFLVVFAGTFVGGLAQSFLFYKWDWYSAAVGPPNFPLVKNVLELLYTQMLVWLGFFFSPAIPGMALVSLFCFFYVKKWTLLLFMIPSTKPYRGYRNSQLFHVLLLLALCLALLPLGLVAFKSQPSPKCGPFRMHQRIYTGVQRDLDHGPAWIVSAVNLTLSHIIVIPAFLLLVLIMYYFKTKSRAHSAEVNQLQDQVEILVADKNFLADKVQAFFASARKGKSKSTSKERLV